VNTGIKSDVMLDGTTMKQFRVCPNPFVDFARVMGQDNDRFIVYDILGRIAGIYNGSSIGRDLEAGIYFLGYYGRPLAASWVMMVKVK
jgi:hypothetical protein